MKKETLCSSITYQYISEVAKLLLPVGTETAYNIVHYRVASNDIKLGSGGGLEKGLKLDCE